MAKNISSTLPDRRTTNSFQFDKIYIFLVYIVISSIIAEGFIAHNPKNTGPILNRTGASQNYSLLSYRQIRDTFPQYLFSQNDSRLSTMKVKNASTRSFNSSMYTQLLKSISRIQYNRKKRTLRRGKDISAPIMKPIPIIDFVFQGIIHDSLNQNKFLIVNNKAKSTTNKLSQFNMRQNRPVAISRSIPPPEQMRSFLRYIRKHLGNTVDSIQVQFIINQWQLFRHQLRYDRQILRDKVVEKNEKEVQIDKLPPMNVLRTNPLLQFLLKQRAIAFSKVRSFEDFKLKLLGEKSLYKSNVLNQTTKQYSPCINCSKLSSNQSKIGVKVRFKRSLSNSVSNEFNTTEETSNKEGNIKSISEYPETLVTNTSPILHSVPEANTSRNSTNYNVDYSTASTHSEMELLHAFQKYQEFLQQACLPKDVTICAQALLGMSNAHTTLFLPPGIRVRRCNNPKQTALLQYIPKVYYDSYGGSTDWQDEKRSPCPSCQVPSNHQPMDYIGYQNEDSCSCATPGDECFPIEVGLKTSAIALLDTTTGDVTTELIVITNHLSCECRSRCNARICVSPLVFVSYTYDDCLCLCPPNDERCQALLNGQVAFTESELPLPLNGSYILPPCYHGIMDEIYLYHRKCPSIRRPTVRKNGR